MKKIHTLPTNLIAKIAAGEVIERPAYAVKELIENAIDANANYITIHVEEAGLKKIVVTDNGEGMGLEDIQECFKPHTTSKIFNEDQLIGIKSLGFRGEALSSISVISSMIIKSRTLDTIVGTQVELYMGNVKNILPVGMPLGSSISIEQLFSTIPARKKFLKSFRTEYRHILDVVTQYAISFPEIRFFLTHDKRIMLDLPLHQTLIERIRGLLGSQISEQLLPISYKDTNIAISGFMSRPQVTTQSSLKQFIYVNNRCVTDKTIVSVIRDAYGSLLDSASYPLFIIFLSVPFEMVDVNVHPRKEYVHFINKEFVCEHIFKAISHVIDKSNITFQGNFGNNSLILEDASTASYAGKILKESIIPWQIKTEILDAKNVFQIHDIYLLTQTKLGISLIDQHAAHERILFEQFLDAYYEKKSKQEIFSFIKPLVIELSVSDAELVKEKLTTFASIGFVIDHFRDNSFLLRSVPMLFHDRDCVQLIREIIDNIQEGKMIKDIDIQTRKMVAYIACRSAIKAGDKLSREEAKNLIEKLQTTQNNATCPHGRPTQIEINLDVINRMFKRK